MIFYFQLFKLASPHLSSYKKKSESFSREHFWKMCTNIHFPTSLKVVFWLLLHLIEFLCRPRLRCLAFYPLGHPIFSTTFDSFSLSLHIKLCLPLSYSLWSFLMHMRLAHTFDKDTFISLCSWEEHTATHNVVQMLCWALCLMWTNSCFPYTISLIIMTTGEYCAYIKCYSHFGKRHHCWFDLFRFCFMNCFFSRNGHDDYTLSKGCVISWLTP
jgi:hypothetical protein